MGKKLLIIGYGSIGKRHAGNFHELSCEVSLVSKNAEGAPFKTYRDLAEALSSASFDIVFICNETEKHFGTLKELNRLNFRGLVIVEKPLFSRGQSTRENFGFEDIRISYNLRFHPLLKRLKEDLHGETVTSVNCYVGQHLSKWRRSVDYRQSYSASAARGGGVVLDLSHEIDFCYWLFGPMTSLFASGGKLSDLEIDSEDTVSILLKQHSSALTHIHLNYTDHLTQRFVMVNTNKKTIKVDFIAKSYQVNEEVVKIPGDIDTYKAMASDILESGGKGLSSYAEGLEVMRVIEGIYSSMKDGRRVEL